MAREDAARQRTSGIRYPAGKQGEPPPAAKAAGGGVLLALVIFRFSGILMVDMSIYAGPIFELNLAFGKNPLLRQYANIFAMAVPSHIGYPDEYPDGDPFSDFLPPVCTQEQYDRCVHRAIVVVDRSRPWKDGQKYREALLTLPGEEFERMGFMEVLVRITAALEARK